MIRSPDEAKIKQKMVYASSRDALKRALTGVAVEVQGTDYAEVAYESGKSFFDPDPHQHLQPSFLCLGVLFEEWLIDFVVFPVLDKANRGN